MRGIRGVRIAKGAGNKASAKKTAPKEVNEEPKPAANIGGALFGVNGDGRSSVPANPFANPFSSPSSSNTNGNAPPNPLPLSNATVNPFSAPAPTVQVTPEETKDETDPTLPETFASKVRLNASPPSQTPRPHEPWPSESSFPPAYPYYHLDAEYETLDAPSTPQIPGNARMDIGTEGSGGGGKEDKDLFESTLDKTFQKFADRVGQNPEQVLRYEFKGKPLLYNDNDTVGKALAAHAENSSSSNAKITTSTSRGASGMARCQNCGADRVFEVQLTPHAISVLEADETSIDGMEWGTIILGVCGNDCKPNDVAEGEAGYLEEWAGVQWEEVASKR